MDTRLAAYNTDDSIAALATPWGESAVAVVRTSGKASIGLAAKVFSRPEKLLASPGGTLIHGFLADPDSGDRVDEVVLGVYRAPKSYTGEDGVEFFCHGGPASVKAVLSLLAKAGFRAAEPGEFTFRAFFRGKMDLTRAEAVREIVSAKTGKARALALHRLSGAVERRINEFKAALTGILAEVEIKLDYPEDEAPDGPFPLEAVRETAAGIDGLLATYRGGRIYQEGVRVALAGKTNAGKSSLFNLFLREDRSIVSDLHGTTRDYIEALVAVEGIPVRLYDTAGLRKTDDPVESEGVRRSREVIEGAAFTVYLVDAELGADAEDEAAIESLGGRCIPVMNKIDRRKTVPPGWLGLSAATGEGFPALLSAIGGLASGGARPGDHDVVIDSERQKTLLERCRASLADLERGAEAGMPLDVLAVDLQAALRSLGEITGEVVTEDVLHAMFSRFCVGK